MSNLPPAPYVGPRAFNPGETLYGRDWETRELRDLILAKRIVLLYSPSGAGKTSLINARLLPELEAEELQTFGPVRVRIDAVHPESALNRYAVSAIQAFEDKLPQQQRAQIAPTSLSAYFKPAEGVPHARRILIFDQFEDVLTQDPTDEAGRVNFFRELGAVLDEYNLYALFSLREEYVAGLDPYLRSIPNRLNARFRITPLDPAAALLAIIEPAKQAGVEFEELAAIRLRDELRLTRVQCSGGRVEEKPGQEVEGLQLQVVCQRLWESRADPSRITIDDLTRGSTTADAKGNVEAALSAYFDQKVAAAASSETPERTIRNWFERRLITTTKLRGQVMESTSEQGLPDKVIEELKSAGLVRAETRRGALWFELSHDRFIEPVLASNAAWKASHPNPIEDQAALWESAWRPDKLLLAGEELAKAERWAQTVPSEVSPSQNAFLRASRRNEDNRAAEAARAKEAERRTNLADIGWSAIFAPGEDPAVIAALRPLLDFRGVQARVKGADYYREFSGPSGYVPGESARQFLLRHGVGSGPATPEKVPYYLLIVGSPERIPFEFQYGFGTQYAVGRIHFETPAEYASYARSVVASESGQFSLAPELVLFGPTHGGDIPTAKAAQFLFEPLAQRFGQAYPNWPVTKVLGSEATKERLSGFLGSHNPPLLTIGGHGMSFPKDHPDQVRDQGAIVCANWEGRGLALKPEYLFGAVDIADDARLLGGILLMASPFSAGTPRFDESQQNLVSRHGAARPFVSHIAQRLLGHPNGGTLAIVGHVDELWMSGFFEQSKGQTVTQFVVFEMLLKRLMDGHTVGSAMEAFRQRYALMSAQLIEDLLPAVSAPAPVGSALKANITATLDIRNYIVLGDPAARLPVRPGVAVSERPSLAFAPVALPQEKVVSSQAPESIVIFNGIDAATSSYALVPSPLQTVVSGILRTSPKEPVL